MMDYDEKVIHARATIAAMTPEQKRALAAAMVPSGAARQARPEKPVVLGPNDPCRCGSGRKLKKCCGNLAGEARVIVADPTTGDVLRDKGTRVALFKEFEGARQAALRTGWLRRPGTELVTLAEVQWRKMAQEMPCADVSLVELASSSPPILMESSDTTDESPGTTGPTSSGSSG